MRRKSIQHHTDALAALLLFGVFAACILAVLITGADAYRRLTLRDRAVGDRRACVQYLATRVRQADYAGSVAVEDFGGGALVLNADSDYPTWLYCRDGWLMELFCYVEERPGPEDGQPLMEAENLSFELEDGLLAINVTMPEGKTETLLLSLRGGEEGAP